MVEDNNMASFDRVSAKALAEVVEELLPPGQMDPAGPEVLQAAVVLLTRMARDHHGDELGVAADRVRNLVQLGVPETVAHQAKDALRRVHATRETHHRAASVALIIARPPRQRTLQRTPSPHRPVS
ncbi:hypothetical protein [Amycolatopsis anabasis]|uniref:hypothetical protein n=1 Tax=Amycolatopsis anabasis TaxID=1840409 RepID=UPI00131C8BF5|nr:hypothetical protein [Amycolatopsis anabasis]